MFSWHILNKYKHIQQTHSQTAASIILSFERKMKERTKRFHIPLYLCVSKGGKRKFIQDVRQYELFLSHILALVLWIE